MSISDLPARLRRTADSATGFVVVVSLTALAAAILLLNVDRVPGTDDVFFLDPIVSPDSPGSGGLANWLAWRYERWSGRLGAEALLWAITPASIWVWRAIAVLVWAATVLLAVRVGTAARPSMSWRARSALALGAFITFFLMDRAVLLWGQFWVTGSLNYGWLVPLALAAAIPAVQALVGARPPAIAWTVVGSIAAFLAAVSSEQIGAVLVVLGVVATAVWWFSARRTGARAAAAVFAPAAAAIAGAVVLFAAPGNAVRAEVDESTWLPGFSAAPLLDRFIGGIQFTAHAMVNRTGVLLAIIWLLVLLIASVGEREVPRAGSRRRAVAIGIAGVSLATLAASRLLSLPLLTEFLPYWQTRPDSAVGVAVVVGWTILLLGTVAAAVLVLPRRFAITTALLILAAYASTFVISFSPSMYASGPRVFFVSSVLLGIVALILASFAARDRSAARVLAVAVPVALMAGFAWIACLIALRWGTGPL